MARILTSPDSYNEETSTILAGKLTHIYSMGLSMIRQGASDAEILQTIDDLTSTEVETRVLVGAIVVSVETLRAYIEDDQKWFGVYATDDRGKLHHIDMLGTIPAGTRSAIKKAQSKRRNKLAEDMIPLVVFSEDPNELLSKLRDAGI
ncbi:hypothetical protein [Sphingomonas sanxanigenens]|nr:hypothetical protein [Sphingomonas sanxanigenens]